jgi:dephospho-CoA kinase
MRRAAFDDPAMRTRLEAILHPMIGVEVEREAGLAAAAPVLVFDVPLLVESGRWRSRVDAVWVVDCDEAVQIARVAARPGWSEDAARAVIAQQASRAARRAAADAVVHNQGISLAELAAEVHGLWRSALATRT